MYGKYTAEERRVATELHKIKTRLWYCENKMKANKRKAKAKLKIEERECIAKLNGKYKPRYE